MTAAAAACAAAGAARAGDEPERRVTLPGSRGELAGLYRPAQSGRGRAVLIVGATGMPIEETAVIAAPLSERCCSVLTLQNPAMPKREVSSTGLPILDILSLGGSSLGQYIPDLEQALKWMASQQSADTAAPVIAGVGLGANETAILLGEHASPVGGFVFIKPGGSCDTAAVERALKQQKGVPALLVTGSGDEIFRRAFLSTSDPLRRILDAPPAKPDSPAAKEWIPRASDIVDWVHGLPAAGS